MDSTVITLVLSLFEKLPLTRKEYEGVESKGLGMTNEEDKAHVELLEKEPRSRKE
ncbi:hypothetical protein MMC24_004509 [Lignoscripta atroalba]|nr:hypothetical protein [Lignoscripta atroalba]